MVENGAVVIDVATGAEQLLAPRIPSRSGGRVPAHRGHARWSIGRVLCSTNWTQEAKLSAAIAKLGVDRQVVRNRDSAMVLPPGISKRTGIEAALRALGELPSGDRRGRRRGERRPPLRCRRRLGRGRECGRRPQGTRRRRAQRAERQGIPVAGGSAGRGRSRSPDRTEPARRASDLSRGGSASGPCGAASDRLVALQPRGDGGVVLAAPDRGAALGLNIQGRHLDRRCPPTGRTAISAATICGSN